MPLRQRSPVHIYSSGASDTAEESQQQLPATSLQLCILLEWYSLGNLFRLLCDWGVLWSSPVTPQIHSLLCLSVAWDNAPQWIMCFYWGMPRPYLFIRTIWYSSVQGSIWYMRLSFPVLVHEQYGTCWIYFSLDIQAIYRATWYTQLRHDKLRLQCIYSKPLPAGVKGHMWKWVYRLWLM